MAGIGTLNEGSLHAAFKAHYAQEGDQLEAVVDGYVVDILRGMGLGRTLIEVQTGSFASIKAKLYALVPVYRIVLVYPIAQTKHIVHVPNPRQPPDGTPSHGGVSRRRSPKRGQPLDLFAELVRIPRLVGHPNLTIDLALCAVDEFRCADGRGSWRRKGVSILEQRLVEVLDTIRLHTPLEFAALLPECLGDRFTNRELAEAAGIRLRLAGRVTYSLHAMGALHRDGRRGQAYVYRRAEPVASLGSDGRPEGSSE